MRRASHVLLRKAANVLVSAALVCSLVPAPGIAYAVEAGEDELALEAAEDSAAMSQDQEQSEQGLQESAQQESVPQEPVSEPAEQDELLPDAAEDENLAAASVSSPQDDDANHEIRAQQRREAMLERQRLAQERREQLRAQYAQYEGVTPVLEEEHAGKSVHDANEDETLVAQATLPRSYDAREHGYVTPVRNQNPLGTCWAFAMTAALESTMLKRGMASLGSLDLSERHAAYFSFHVAVDALKGLAGDSTTAVGSEYGSNAYQKSMRDPYLICGNTASSAARSASTWAGPVNENVAPYQALIDRYYDDVDNGVKNAASFLSVTNLSDTLARNSANNRALLDEYRFVLMKDRDDVKQAIIDYGGGSLAFAWDSDYMNYGTASYCSVGKTNSSHIVELIGWDDDYPRANFGFTYFNDDGYEGYTDVPDTSSTTPLELNKTKEVALKVGEENKLWFTFVPPTDGCYQFYADSYGRQDWPEPYLYRVASANDQLTEGYFSNDFYDADAFSGEALLRAGVTYYVSVCIDRPDAEEGESCPFTMTVTQADGAADDCPAHDGAWLCKNSWGSGWASNDGYFWISYEDCILARDDWDVAFYGAVPTSKYNNNYQYDGTTSWNTDTVSSGGSISNVFTAKAYPGGGEQLKAVTLSLDDVNVDYAVQVYLNLTDPNNPTSGTPYLAQPVTGKTHYAGYYTIDLPNPVPLREGTDFSVVITLSHEDGSNVTYMADASSSTSYSRSVNAVTKQQSFVKATASSGWKDLATVRLADTDAPGVSARIKAFTTNVSASSMPVPRIDHAAVTLGAASFAYTGSAVTPAVTVRYGEDILVEGTDYTVSYQDNVEVGTAQVTVRGRGSYTGSKSVTFAIKKVPVITATNKSVVATKTVNLGARVTAGAGKISYTSSDTKVATVTASGVVTGVSSGKATITISCAENDQYLGASKKVTVTVSKAANTLAAKAKKKKVSVKAKKVAKKKLVLASNVKVSNAKGAVTYANVSTKKAAKKLKVNAKTGKITVPKRLKKGTYVVKVRVTTKGTNAYAAATKTVTFKVVVK